MKWREVNLCTVYKPGTETNYEKGWSMENTFVIVLILLPANIYKIP